MPARVHVSKPSEAGVQRACLALLQALGIFAFRVNCGARPWTDKAGRQRSFKLTSLDGVSDVILVVGGRVAFVEIKTPRGKLRPSQAAFLDLARQAGAVTAVIRSVDELRELLRYEFGWEA